MMEEKLGAVHIGSSQAAAIAWAAFAAAFGM